MDTTRTDVKRASGAGRMQRQLDGLMARLERLEQPQEHPGETQAGNMRAGPSQLRDAAVRSNDSVRPNITERPAAAMFRSTDRRPLDLSSPRYPQGWGRRSESLKRRLLYRSVPESEPGDGGGASSIGNSNVDSDFQVEWIGKSSSKRQRTTPNVASTMKQRMGSTSAVLPRAAYAGNKYASAVSQGIGTPRVPHISAAGPSSSSSQNEQPAVRRTASRSTDDPGPSKASTSSVFTASATVLAAADVDSTKLSPRLSYAPHIETAGMFRSLRGANLPPIKFNGETYRIGDFISYQYPATEEEESPGAWIGMLVDYSAGNPVYESDSVVDHLRPGECGIDFVGIRCAYTQGDVDCLVKGEMIEHPNILYKNKRGFYKTFLAEDTPDNVRFLSTDVEWRMTAGITGLANPSDVGGGLRSSRTITIPFLGPWIGIDQVVKQVRKGEVTCSTLSVLEQPDVGGLPSGFIKEVKREVEGKRRMRYL